MLFNLFLNTVSHNFPIVCKWTTIDDGDVYDEFDDDYYYAPQLYRQVLLRRVLAMGILSVCLSVCLSRPGGIPSPGELETARLHHTIAQSL